LCGGKLAVEGVIEAELGIPLLAGVLVVVQRSSTRDHPLLPEGIKARLFPAPDGILAKITV